MLKCSEVIDDSARITLSVSEPTPHVIIVKAGPGYITPGLHWRIGRWRKPPFVISFEQDSGVFIGFEYALQDEYPKSITRAYNVSRVIKGLPVFDLENWPLNSRYLDVDGDTFAFWLQSGDLVLTIIDVVLDVVVCEINDKCSVLFDIDMNFVGVRLSNLSTEEKNTIG